MTDDIAVQVGVFENEIDFLRIIVLFCPIENSKTEI